MEIEFDEFPENRRRYLILNIFVLKFLGDHDILKTQCFQSNDFPSLSGLMALWKKEKLDENEDWGDPEPFRCSYNAKQFILKFFEETENLDLHDPVIFGYIYQEIISVQEKKKNGIFYTPVSISKYMSGLIQNDHITTCLDPACGAGSLLCSFYDQIMESVPVDLQEVRHKQMLQNELWGFDTDPLAVIMTKLSLALRGNTYCYPSHIMREDALMSNLLQENKFDLILGNPPYMGHKQIEKERMILLREKYNEVYGDKGDLSYCFFGLAYHCLRSEGQCVFLVSRYFIEAQNGKKLRHFLEVNTDIVSIIDYNGHRPFYGVGIDPLIIVFRKQKYFQKIQITKYPIPLPSKQEPIKKKPVIYFVNQNQLDADAWRLYDPNTQEIISKIRKKTNINLSDLAQSFQGIITGRDRVFVMDEEKRKQEKINTHWAVPWIKNKNVQLYCVIPSNQILLFLDQSSPVYNDEQLLHYLMPFYDDLKIRRECQTGKIPWYGIQWPRQRSLFEQEKIIFPYKAEKNRFAIDSNHCFFSADIYGLLSNKISLKALTVLLNSKLYDFYFKSFAKKLGGNLYEYYPNRVMRLKLPLPGDEFYFHLECLYDIIKNSNKIDYLAKRNADIYIDDFFHLTAQERRIIGE